MSTSDRIPVAPSVLQWARRTAGFGEPEAAAKLTVNITTLQKWENGQLQPTLKQLRKISECYKRPLAVLLLSQPPKDFDALRDFRRLQVAQGTQWSVAMHAEFKRAITQREVFLELAEIASSSVIATDPLPAVSTRQGAEEVATALRAYLGVETWAPRNWASRHDALNAYVDAVERKGILVINTRDILLSEMRGFSISEQPYPVIALNGKDWPSPRLFTLMHELSHIALRAGGMCDLHEHVPSTHPREEDFVERFCNQVAASILMPPIVFLADRDVRSRSEDYPWTSDELERVGRRFGASREAVLLRLINLGKATWQLYRSMKPQLDQEYADAQRREKERQQANEGGPSYYVVKARNLGRHYISSVLDAFHSRNISSLDAANYLDIKYDQIPKLEEAVR
ncbi:ImmA/IrrE family metallo-endopeptidase [Microbispora sp. SCL1-1]|uniref:XRE family transcriptional regulator n=1 Tax=Microbispora TaxID=2005 RepID=UPI001158F8B1|nr:MULTISPECIES: XRE family transcriptional regulator [unclassified Microbispora]NJP30258.1 ImmA/IrrE family metallo-endopeptidase [Microbispora sp. CL1-1]TQS02237.1 ImmA/IrrE family metallo-endopeptidase [Microbispora sp. SCL1-1]